jgi:hypothetical protein
VAELSSQAIASSPINRTSKVPAAFKLMQSTQALIRYAMTLSLIALASCNGGSSPKPAASRLAANQVYEATGNSQQRIKTISAIITKHRSLPTAIADAHFLEERIGDGELGPSDYRDFYVVDVATQDIEQWSQGLIPLQEVPEYVEPPQPRNWWIDRDAFTSLQFYEPTPLTGRSTGWIAISRQIGKIYIFTFTT